MDGTNLLTSPLASHSTIEQLISRGGQAIYENWVVKTKGPPYLSHLLTQ